MVIRLLFKNTLIKIKKSFGRYVSLFIIVMVGVGFLLGLRESPPDILAGVSTYYKAHHLMDFKIVSTMGLTSDDVNALKSLKGVKAVIPSYSLDVLSQGKAVKVQAIEHSVNTVKLISGRMPKKDTECLADSKVYKTGDKITIAGDVSGKLKNTVFTVAGTVQSPLYMATDYGNTAIGDGKLSSFIFVNKDNFTMDSYTEIYLIAADAKNVAAYSKEYEKLTSHLNNELVKLKPERENARYREIYDKAAGKINDSQTKLNNEKAKAQKQLSDAKSQLDANTVKLSSAKRNLNKNEADLYKNIDIQNAKFQTAKAQIANGWDKINAALNENGIKKEELNGKIKELDSAIKSMKEQQSQLSTDSPEYADLTAQINKYQSSYQGLVKLKSSIATLTSQEDQLNKGIATYNTQIAKAKQDIAKGKTDLAQNEKKLNDGYSKYNENLVSFNKKMSDAQAKIDDAKRRLSTIEKPKWYLYDRDSVVGYDSLKSGTDIINSVAVVFPLFFILIVMLMTSNTMARMIMEERGELGTLTSLGFKDISIISTYLVYVLSATVLGAVTGFSVGTYVFPKIIYSAFINFILPPLVIQHNMNSFLLVLAAAVILMTGVTVFFCYGELRQRPAALMRPVPPKHGQKILLERIGFIWKHLSFTWKVTMRNIFRYKSRVLMTVVGVAGCTAILVTGFGLRDSIDGVAERQYGEIFRYHAIMALKNTTPNIGGNLESLLKKEKVVDPLLIKQTTFKAGSGNQSIDTYLIVPENHDLFQKYFHLTNPSTGSGVTLNDSGAVITQKLAEILKTGKGGTIRIKDADNNVYSLPVSGVTENYMQNYIYLSKNLYGKVFGEDVSYNMIVSDYSQNETVLAKHLLGDGSIVNITFKSDILRQAADGNKSINNVVVLLVVIAAIMVIIVLYNLTSINISERKREISTLKVLGFNDNETNQYIYREAFLLTLLSIGVGLLLGIPLHRFVIETIESDTTVYFKNIRTLSFVWSSLIIILVSVVMQTVTYFKMKKIDMIESLKSVE